MNALDYELFLSELLDRASRELFPKLGASALVIALDTGKVDPKLALELGAAILLNKPILALVKKGSVAHPRLKLIAEECIEYDGIRDPQTLARLKAALKRIMEKPTGKTTLQ